MERAGVAEGVVEEAERGKPDRVVGQAREAVEGCEVVVCEECVGERGVAKRTSKIVSMWGTDFGKVYAVRILGKGPRLTFRAFTFNIKIMHFSNATPF